MNFRDLIPEAQSAFATTLSPAPFVISHGEGSFLFDTDNQRYLDFSSGIAVTNLGHAHPQIVRAVQDQIAKVAHTSNMYWNQPSMELAIRLKKNSFADRIFLCNSGTEANEAALKLARKFHADAGKPRAEFLSFQRSFHGRTFGSLSATGQEKYWKGFEPLVPGFKFGTYNDLKSAELITEATAGVILEVIQAEGGVYPANAEFLSAIRKKCDQTGALLIFDEVQTGMGRTGKLFCYEHYQINPDIMSLAKGLGGGIPIGAMLAKETVAKSFTLGSHATTFGGNPVAAAAANAVLNVTLEKDFFSNLEKNISFFWSLLNEKVRTHPKVSDIRGMGFLIGIELKEDISKTFDLLRAKRVLTTRIPPRVIRILPPLTAKQDELKLFIEEFVSVLNT